MIRPISPHVTVIVKVTNGCNMDCRYCFIEPSVSRKTMTAATARRVIRSFLDSTHFQTVHFVWHGGEPLLRSRDFFARLFSEQHSQPTRVVYTNSIQTNATRLDDVTTGFLIDNGVHIGLSLDGPQSINDRVRRMRGTVLGSPSPYSLTTAAAGRLRQHGLFPGAIVVVNRNNIDEPEAIYREFRLLRLNMKLNCLTWSGKVTASLRDLTITPDEYGAFLVRMFDLWFDDPEPVITIEPFRQHIGRILGLPGTVSSCYFTRGCHHYFLGVSPDGELYPCGMFQGETAFRYGTIHEMAPEEVGASDLFQRLDARECKVLKRCASCPFLDLCYGGCMFHSLKNSHAFGEKDFYCPAYRMYFEHALRRVHSELIRTSAAQRYLNT